MIALVIENCASTAPNMNSLQVQHIYRIAKKSFQRGQGKHYVTSNKIKIIMIRMSVVIMSYVIMSLTKY